MPTLEDEIAFISGLNADGSLAAKSFNDWNSDSPATYNPTKEAATKWFGTPNDTVGMSGGTVNYYFDPGSSWTASEEQVFTDGFALWSAVANINFVQTTDLNSADAVILRGTDGSAETFHATTNTPSNLTEITAALISIDTSVPGFGPITENSFAPYGGYAWNTILHEEGHLLGLGHAGPYNGTVDPATMQYSSFDNRAYSIMSYIKPMPFRAPPDSVSADFGITNWMGANYDNVPQTMMLADILAAQRLYGARTDGPLSGGQVFGFNTNIQGNLRPFFDFTINTKPILSIWDSGSNNKLDLSSFSQASNIDLRAGHFSSIAGMTNNISIASGTHIDSVITGTGNDTIGANDDGDTIDPGAGSNNIGGGAGNDTIYGRAGSNLIDGGAGIDKLVISGNFATLPRFGFQEDGTGWVQILSADLSFQDTFRNIEYIQYDDLTLATPTTAGTFVIEDRLGDWTYSGTDGFDTFNGGAGNETFHGGAGSDILRGGRGTNVLDGGSGIDTAGFSLPLNYYFVTAKSDGSYTVQGPGETDTLTGIEYAFSDSDPTKKSISLSDFIAESFNPLAYIASFPDLIRGAGDNAQVGLQHYLQHGYYEGRGPGSFNALQYIASYSDLIKGAGDNQTVGLEHYILHGYYEGRTATFNALQYIASYGDLIKGAGDNETIGLEHYILHGFYEGRAPTFNALQYIASYGDLVRGAGDSQTVGLEHYILHGYAEGRTVTFDPLAYVASYSDLIRGAGVNQTVALEHYILHGFDEGRTVTFDPVQYIASYDDLIRGTHGDITIGEEHYILHGFDEGRMPTFDAVGYLLSNPDLQHGGYDPQKAELQFVQTGFYQGRSRSDFGTDQTEHTLTLSTQVNDNLTIGDKDWFSVELTAGTKYDFTLTSGSPGTLSDPLLSAFNSEGVPETSSGNIGGAMAHFWIIPHVSGTCYLTVGSNIASGSGNYGLLVAPGN